MRQVRPGFPFHLELLFDHHVAAALFHRVDPILYGQHHRHGRAVFGDADGNKARIGKEERAKAGAVLVGRSAYAGIDSRDELVERGRGWAGGNLCGDFGFRFLCAKGRRKDNAGEGEEEWSRRMEGFYMAGKRDSCPACPQPWQRSPLATPTGGLVFLRKSVYSP